MSELSNHSDSELLNYFFWTLLENCVTVPLVESKGLMQKKASPSCVKHWPALA